MAMKEVPNRIRSACLISHECSGLQNRIISEQRKKLDGVKNIRFADSVDARNTGKGTHPNIDIDEVFEAGDFEASEHSSGDLSKDAARN